MSSPPSVRTGYVDRLLSRPLMRAIDDAWHDVRFVECDERRSQLRERDDLSVEYQVLDEEGVLCVVFYSLLGQRAKQLQRSLDRHGVGYECSKDGRVIVRDMRKISTGARRP